MSFADDIAKFAKKVDLDMPEVKVVVFTQLAESIVQLTPVKTGRAKGNWIPTVNTFSDATIDTLDKSGGATIAKAMKVAKSAKGDDSLCLSNNLPYIKKLEDGSSKQSPAGMLGLSVQRFESALKKAVDGL